MTFHVEKAGVSQVNWNLLLERLPKYTEDQIDKLTSFLTNLKNKEWLNVHRTWTLPNATPQMWENMETMFSDTTFPEYIILDRHRKLLAATCRRFLTSFNGKIHKQDGAGSTDTAGPN